MDADINLARAEWKTGLVEGKAAGIVLPPEVSAQ